MSRTAIARAALSITVLGAALLGQQLFGAGAGVSAPATTNSGSPAAGTLFVNDEIADQLLTLPPGGGAQTVIGSGFGYGADLAVDAAGDVFVCDGVHNQIVELPAGSGAQKTVAAGIDGPSGIALDAAGDLFILENPFPGHVVELPAGGGPQKVVVTGLLYPNGLAVDPAGDVYVDDSGHNKVVEVPADGGPEKTIGNGFDAPNAVAVDTAGDVYVVGYGHNQVVEVPAGGGAQKIIGTGLQDPQGVAVDAAGNVYITDAGLDQVVEVPAGGAAQKTVASGLSYPQTVAAYAPPPTFTAATPPTVATIGTSYRYAYEASTPAGEPAARFRISSGTLPPGLTLDPTTGALSGTPTTAGTYTFTAETINAATGTLAAPVSMTVAKTAQTITFTSSAPTDAVPNGPGYTPTATGGASGQPVTLTIDPSTSSICRITNGDVTYQQAGTCLIDANQAGTSTYAPAPQTRQVITVAAAAVPPSPPAGALPPAPPSTSSVSNTGVDVDGLMILALSCAAVGLLFSAVSRRRTHR